MRFVKQKAKSFVSIHLTNNSTNINIVDRKAAPLWLRRNKMHGKESPLSWHERERENVSCNVIELKMVYWCWPWLKCKFSLRLTKYRWPITNDTRSMYVQGSGSPSEVQITGTSWEISKRILLWKNLFLKRGKFAKCLLPTSKLCKTTQRHKTVINVTPMRFWFDDNLFEDQIFQFWI